MGTSRPMKSYLENDEPPPHVVSLKINLGQFYLMRRVSLPSTVYNFVVSCNNIQRRLAILLL